MKYLNKTILYLVLAVIVTLAACFIEYKDLQTERFDLDIGQFQKTLHKKEHQLEQLIENISLQLYTSGVNPLSRDNSGQFDHLLEDKGFAVFIFENDTLKFWTDNAIPVAMSFSNSKLDKDIVQFENAWYEVKVNESDNRKIVGLLLLKQEYSYENKFLENKFQDDFKIRPTVNISLIPYSEGYPVYNSSGDYLFFLVPECPEDLKESNSYIPLALFMLAVLLVLVFLYYAVEFIYSQYRSNWWLVVLLADLVLIRVLMTIFEFPNSLYNLELFGPTYFAYSAWLPSLGDFLLNAFFALCFFYIFSKKFYLPKLLDNSQTGITIFTILSGILTVIFLVATYFLISWLILNSSLQLEVSKITDLDFYSVVGYLTIALLLAVFVFVCDKLVSISLGKMPINKFLTWFGIPAAGVLLVAYFSVAGIDLASIAFYLIINGLIIYIRYYRETFKYPALVLVVFIMSLFATWFVVNSSATKEANVRKILALNLANERDPIAELLLTEELDGKLWDDKILAGYVYRTGDFQNANFETFQYELFNYLWKKYFVGFWTKYDLQVTLCSSSQDFPEDHRLESCKHFFNDKIKKQGIQLPGTNFYYLDNSNGRISYLGLKEITSTTDSSKVNLYIELESKLITEELGYPELLLNQKISKKSSLANYSYAKYNKGKLITQEGLFPFCLEIDVYGFEDKEFSFVQYEGYTHLRYRIDDENTILISRPELEMLDVLISFSYIFIFFYFLLTTSLLIHNGTLKLSFKQLNFKQKLQFAMISVLMLSLVLIALGTVYYNIKQYKNKQNQNVSEKIQSVQIELSHKLGEEKELTPAMNEYLTSLLIKFSNVFFSDINLYSMDGTLLASSRPEIFSKGLIGDLMNAEAYRNMKFNKKAKFIHNEQIGTLDYLSVYVPFNNLENKQLAYLNLPYFSRQTALTQEVTALVVTIINIYLLLLLLTIVVTLFITNRLTQPLRLIQQNFREMELGKVNEPIKYQGSDEIGSLVKEYNRMLEELAVSAALLAKSERESAWREMAKQIAHEIKNPLTPMKLSMQHLLRSWHDKSPDWGDRLEKVSETIIEQIDSLSAIATEFSNFAKMPKASNEIVNVCEKMRSTLHLFEDMENVDFTVDFGGHTEANIYADKEQLVRIFNNLLKNAIQSIPAGQDGKIDVMLRKSEDKVLIEIKDNGSGIAKEMEDKLFIPNFTTKTSGMGLGLAMVKNIVEGAKGSIWFETQFGIGTSFFVEFSLVENEK